MSNAKTSQRAEQRALQEKMRGYGLSHRQIASELGRRYKLRPRAAWRHAYGWSLKQAAEMINSFAAHAGIGPDGATVAMTGPHLCETENWPGYGPKPAGRRPTPYLLSLLATVYDCAVADLLDMADYEHMHPADRLIISKTSPARVDTGALPASGHRDRAPGVTECGELDEVRRSEFLKVTGVTLAGLLAPPPPQEWPGAPDPRSPELSHLMLAQIRAQTEEYRWLDRKNGARDVLPGAVRHAEALASMWQRTAPASPLRQELAAAAADACHLVAYQAFDQGQRASATGWYRRAAWLAASGAAQDLYVFAACGVAFMHARNDDGELALSVLRQLAPLRLSAAGGCYLSVYQAHAHASLRQPDAALRALDGAAKHAARVPGQGGAPSPWLGIPDEAFVDRQRAIILARFGLPGAVPLLERLDRRTGDVFQRYRVTLLADRAMAHARLGQVEPAADLLVAAVRRNERVRSAEKREQVLAVRQVLRPHESARAVRNLDEVLRATGSDASTPQI
jgi:hypothetical protein